MYIRLYEQCEKWENNSSDTLVDAFIVQYII